MKPKQDKYWVMRKVLAKRRQRADHFARFTDYILEVMDSDDIWSIYRKQDLMELEKVYQELERLNGKYVNQRGKCN